MRYRRDIGEQLVAAHYAKVQALGLMGDEIGLLARPPSPPVATLHATRS
jgi:phosphoribosylamine--glycine ligase